MIRHAKFLDGGEFPIPTAIDRRAEIQNRDPLDLQFNASEIFGSAVAAAISNYSYYPYEDKILSNTAKVWGPQAGWDGIAIVLREFGRTCGASLARKSTPRIRIGQARRFVAR